MLHVDSLELVLLLFRTANLWVHKIHSIKTNFQKLVTAPDGAVFQLQKRHILRKSSLFTQLTDTVYHSKQLSDRATFSVASKHVAAH